MHDDDEYLQVRVTRRWVPDWLFGLVVWCAPLAMLLTVHDDTECECPCHAQPGMQDCAFCGWRA